MFIYFHDHKFLNNNKGQLVPIFIIVFVVVIIMAMVTINLGKVALNKTDTANGADAGSLACGSVMANVFNGTAIANSNLEVAYQEFYLTFATSAAKAVYDMLQATTAANLAIAASQKAQAEAKNNALIKSMSSQTSCLPDIACMSPKDISAAWSSLLEVKHQIGVAAQKASEAAQMMQKVISNQKKMIVALTAFHIAQYYTYLMIRKTAKKGRESAIEMGHKFNFMNSNIGGKLRPGSPPAVNPNSGARKFGLITEAYAQDEGLLLDAVEKAQTPAQDFTKPDENYYRNTFSDFMDGLGSAQQYMYAWVDGQSREHSVESIVITEDVNTFDLQVTVMPLPVSVGTMFMGLMAASASKMAFELSSQGYTQIGAMLTGAMGQYSGALGPFIGACTATSCCSPRPPDCDTCGALNAACASGKSQAKSGDMTVDKAIIAMKEADAGVQKGITAAKLDMMMLGLVTAGLLPGRPIKSTGGDIAETITWINDIVHDRIVLVHSNQHHGGADLGLYETQYPDLKSYSKVNFEGSGSIYPPEPKFDPSIVETDSPTRAFDTCPKILERYNALRGQAVALRQQADAFDGSGGKAEELEAQAAALEGQGYPDEALTLRQRAQELRQQAVDMRDSADDKDKEAESIAETNPTCNYGLPGQ